MTQVVLALVLGVLFAIGTFLMLRRDVVRVVWGVTIVSQSANVYLVTMGGLGGVAPVLGHGGSPDPSTITDPLVQALVLTAIVIGFGTTALALVLTYRLYEEHGTIDLREVGGADEQVNGAGDQTNGSDDEQASGTGQDAVADGGVEVDESDGGIDDYRDGGVDDYQADGGVDDYRADGGTDVGDDAGASRTSRRSGGERE